MSTRTAAIALLLLIGCRADPPPLPPLGDDAVPGGWRTTVALKLEVGINGCAIGDVDPLRPGNEIVTVAADGGVHLVWREAGAWRSERIAKLPGEMIQVAVGDLLPEEAGLEIVAVGNAEGEEDDDAPGVAVLIRRDGPRWSRRTIFRSPRLVHGVCVVRGVAFVAGYDDQVHRVTRLGGVWGASASALPGAGRSIAPLADGAVVACKNGALVRLGSDGKTQVLDRRDVGRARIGTRGVHVIASDDDGVLTVLRGAPDPALRGVAQRGEIHRSADKLRGAVLADLDPDRPGLEAATAGYAGTIVILYPEEAGWRSQAVANDADRFHHLAHGRLPDHRGLSLVGANLSGRLIVVHRSGGGGP